MRKANKGNVSLHTHRNSLCDTNSNSTTCFLADQDKLGGVTATLVPPRLCLSCAELLPIPHLPSWLNGERNGSMVRKASRVSPGFGHSAQETCAHVAFFSLGVSGIICSELYQSLSLSHLLMDHLCLDILTGLLRIVHQPQAFAKPLQANYTRYKVYTLISDAIWEDLFKRKCL